LEVQKYRRILRGRLLPLTFLAQAPIGKAGILRPRMTQIFSLTALGLALALGSAHAQTLASVSASAAIVTPTSSALASATTAATAITPATATAAAPRPTYRTSRPRGQVVQRIKPAKICNVLVNAEKGEVRTASLSACIKN
jgi:hypothetical protein